MKKKIILLLIGCLFFTGCWNYKELNDYAICTGFAIDMEEGKYKVSLLISNSAKQQGSSKEGEAQTVVYDGTGETILEAVKQIGLISPKELYLGHLVVVVISEEVAKNGMTNVMDYLFRDSQSRKMFYIIIAKDVEAEDTLKILSPLETFPSQNIAMNIESTSKLQAVMTNVDYNQFIRMMIEDGIEPAVNSVTIEGEIEEGEKTESLDQAEPAAKIKLGELGIFKGDKFIGWTTKNQNRGINIINDRVKTMYITLDCPDSEGKLVITTTQFKTGVDVKMEAGEPLFNVKSNVVALINEVDCKLALEKPETIKKLEELTENKIKEYMQEGVDVTQKEYQSDVFGFGKLVHQNYPAQWKQWRENWNEEKFPTVKINFDVQVKLENKGSLEQDIKEAKNEK